MAKSYDIRKRRERLHQENPHCHWCGRLTMLIKRKGNYPCQPFQATLDHLYDRLDPSRYLPNVTREQRYVIACYECNAHRGAERQRYEQFIGNPAAFGSETVERRSYTRFSGRLMFKIGEVAQLRQLSVGESGKFPAPSSI